MTAAATLLLAAALPGSRGAAQSLSVSLGGSVAPGASPALHAGLTVRNVALVVGYGLSARFGGDLGPGGGFEAAGLVDLPLDLWGRQLSLYGGPALSLRLGQGPRLRPALIGGLAYDLNGQLGLYAEASYRIQDTYRVRAGVSYSF